MNPIDRTPAGPGPRTLAEVLFQPRSDKPTADDLRVTLGDPGEIPARSSEMAHKLLEIMSEDPSITPMLLTYALAHALVDLSLAIGNEIGIGSPNDRIGEIAIPALFESIPMVNALKILAAGVRVTANLKGTSVEELKAQARANVGRDSGAVLQ